MGKLGMENIEGWYALFLAICKNYTVDEAIRAIYGKRNYTCKK